LASRKDFFEVSSSTFSGYNLVRSTTTWAGPSTNRISQFLAVSAGIWTIIVPPTPGRCSVRRASATLSCDLGLSPWNRARTGEGGVLSAATDCLFPEKVRALQVASTFRKRAIPRAIDVVLRQGMEQRLREGPG